MSSTLKGAKGGYQGMDLQTSGKRERFDLCNSYPLGP